MNIIYCPIQGGIQKPKLKYYLGKYFNITYSNLPNFIQIILLQPNPEYLVLESFL